MHPVLATLGGASGWTLGYGAPFHLLAPRSGVPAPPWPSPPPVPAVLPALAQVQVAQAGQAGAGKHFPLA